MDFGIRDKVAFVIGGSKGMVGEAAKILAGEGAKMFLVARTPGPLEEAAEQMRGQGATVATYAGDMSTREAIAGAVAACTEKFGSPDIAVTCMVNNIAGDFDDVKDDEFDLMFRAYVMSVVYLAREVIPEMKRKGWGRFVHVGSATAKEPVGNIHHMLANATRPGAVGFVKTLSDEVAKFGITCNTIAPGWIGTENMYNYLEKKVGVGRNQVPEFLNMIPAGRVGRPEEIGSTIAYLCSQGAGYLTGSYITVDGGKHAAAF